MKRRWQIVISLLVAVGLLSGCNQGTEGKSEVVTKPQGLAYIKEEKSEYTDKEKIYYGMDEGLYESSLVNAGDSARLAALMKKAENGGHYKIAVFGGSISEGTGASGPDSCYGRWVCNWWIKNFPKSTFEFVNAGMGATNAEMGCYRMERDLLSYQPDFVIVDFTVNCYLDRDVSGTYSTVLYKILMQDNAPAVMAIDFTSCDEGQFRNGNYIKTKEVPNQEIRDSAKQFNVPHVSYHEYVWAKIGAGELSWMDIGADFIHPNDNGHRLGASIVRTYLDKVKETVGNIDTTTKDLPLLTDNRYTNLQYVTNETEGAELSGAFVANDNSSARTRGWSYKAMAGASQLHIPLPQNKGVKILIVFDGGSEGMVTVKGQNGMTSNIMPGKALTPTLVDVGSMGNFITINPNMANGGFTIYGICINS